MSTTTRTPLTPTRPHDQEPPAEPRPAVPPTAELADRLRNLEQAQAETDRRKAEELARLREIQSRD